jgi:hypothetical protein
MLLLCVEKEFIKRMSRYKIKTRALREPPVDGTPRKKTIIQNKIVIDY